MAKPNYSTLTAAGDKEKRANKTIEMG